MPLDWGAQLLRVSLFSTGPVQISDSDWALVTGEDEAPTRQALPGGRQLSGKFQDAQLALVAIPGRLDFVMTPMENEQQLLDSKIAVVGQWDEARERFFDFTSRWITNASFPVIRIAFGAVLICPTTDIRDSYVHLKKLVKSLQIDPDRMRDLLYRVNWSRTSATLPDLIINRLTTWLALRVFAQVAQSTGVIISADPAVQLYGVRLDIDHNTAETNQEPFDHTKIIPIYGELVQLACENASEGEVP